MSLHYQLKPKPLTTVLKRPENQSYSGKAENMGNMGNSGQAKNMGHEWESKWYEISSWFGEKVKNVLNSIRYIPFTEVEEIRLRIGQPLLIRTFDRDVFLDSQGNPSSIDKGYRVAREDIVQTLERMTQSSIYAAEEELRQGFLTLPGGHRVGITGEVVLNKGQIQTLKHISGINLRIARAVIGRAIELLPSLTDSKGEFKHTLLISPPRAGKTTLLRDLIRSLSEGVPHLGITGQTVGVIDERGELAGSWQGNPVYNLGPRTDVLDGCPKAQGLAILIRAMSPTIVAMDELGHPDDVTAVRDALRTGVKIISTAHASTLEEARKRPALRPLFEDGVFERLVVLSRRKGAGTVEVVYDLNTGKEVFPKTRSEVQC
ncbi:MAG: stage III sporulation protein AA [Desulfitobacterium hafniense]|nr:stage III sporulation protein AA [Desulfitobacterium hafniense]